MKTVPAIVRQENTAGFELTHSAGRLEVSEVAPGVLLQILVGEALAAYIGPVTAFVDEKTARGQRITLLLDYRAATASDPSPWVAWLRWLRQRRESIVGGLALLGPALGQREIDAANAILDEPIATHEDAATFQDALEALLRTRASTTDAPAELPGTIVDLRDPNERSDLIELSLGTGSVIADGYRLAERIGRGGSGTVYRGLQLSLDRPVAVKLLHLDEHQHPAAFRRFRREIDIVGRLAHPNIVQIIDAGTTPRGSYLVMELLEGKLLRELVREGGLPPAEALTLFDQICAGVAVAHAERVIHRDLTPNNVFVVDQDDGSRAIKILDFGLAQPPEEGEAIPSGEGETLGTPGFMAPEQIERDAPISERTDIYALGALLYFMLTGRSPFPGESVDEVWRAQLGGRFAPLPATLDPLAAEIGRALSVSPRHRHRSVEHMRQRFARAGGAVGWITPLRRRHGVPTGAHVAAASPPWRKPAVTVAAFLALALVVAAIVWL